MNDAKTVAESIEPARRSIAVIVVHGVGDQQPLESARRIGDLLQDLDVGTPVVDGPAPLFTEPRSVDPVYDPFTERAVRINVRPVVIAETAKSTAAAAGMRGPFHAWVTQAMSTAERESAGSEAARKTNDAEAPRQIRSVDEEVARQFMRGQLRFYTGDNADDTYDTIRLEGTRTAGSGRASRTVHLYELYWADLSRLKVGLLSIFTELYQLLFHLSSLGTHVVDAEAMHHRTRSWRWFRSAQSTASVVLTVPIPIVNLLMLGVAGIVLGLVGLGRLRFTIQVALVGAVLGAAVVAGAGWWMWRERELPATFVWLAPVFLWVAVLPPAVRYVGSVCSDDLMRAGGCEMPRKLTRLLESGVLLLLVAALIALLLRAYDRRRPGAATWGRRLALLLLPVGFLSLFYHSPDNWHALVFAWVRVFEVLFGALSIGWVVLFLLAVVSFVMGELAVGTVKGESARALARRSRWTARLMLSLPAFAFIVITLTGWALLALAVKPLVTGIAYRTILPWVEAHDVETLMAGFLNNPATIALPIVLVAGGIAVLPGLWGLAPIVWAEMRPPDARKATTGPYSARLGDWLTKAFSGLLISGVILYVAMTFLLPAGTLLALSPELRAQVSFLKPIIFRLGGLSGVAFAWLFAMRGRLRTAALGFRPVVDILLDVDNWLREHPLNANPKARICGRYVSLLRYICDWKDPRTKAPYDAIVIVAHSQGTVISADLLRFLRSEAAGSLATYDPHLARLDAAHPKPMPVYLFTMGCPLRDLYGRRFPRLYHWARHGDDSAMDPWQKHDLKIPPTRGLEPDPDALGVELWVNAYRSGDYIGRFLWRTKNCSYVWTGDRVGSPVVNPLQHNSTDGLRRLEFCIGAGTHTHYWDSTARVIADELDRLIEIA